MKFIDLFCGAGLGARGAVAAGAEPVLAVDQWGLATQTYKANFPEADVRTQPVDDLDPFSLSSHYHADVLLTSPECTSHSIARGARPGCEKSRLTALSSLPWIDAFNPRWVVVENVTRLKSWSRHSELKEELRSRGYYVSELVLNSADFGAPQARQRLFILCDKSGVPPEPRFRSDRMHTAREILDPEGTWRSKPLETPERASATLERAYRAIKSLGKGTPFIIVYYGSDYAGGWQTLDAPLRTVTTIDRFGLVTWRGGTPYLRMLQPPELLRAMGAENHQLPSGSRRERVKLCGNGVCSPVMEAIFRAFRQSGQTGTVVGREATAIPPTVVK